MLDKTKLHWLGLDTHSYGIAGHQPQDHLPKEVKSFAGKVNWHTSKRNGQFNPALTLDITN